MLDKVHIFSYTNQIAVRSSVLQPFVSPTNISFPDSSFFRGVCYG